MMAADPPSSAAPGQAPIEKTRSSSLVKLGFLHPASRRGSGNISKGNRKDELIMQARGAPQRRRSSLLRAFRALMPWKWRKPKQPAPSLEATAKVLERKLSRRPNRAQAIATGVVKDSDVAPEALLSVPSSSASDVDVDDCVRSVMALEPSISPASSACGMDTTTDEELTDSDPDHSEEEDEEEDFENKLYIRLRLRSMLERRPTRKDLEAKNILHQEDPKTDVGSSCAQGDASQGNALTEQKKKSLERKLSVRSSRRDLEHLNILHAETEEQRLERKKSIKAILKRKLSTRASVRVLKDKKILKFDAYAEVTETWGDQDYDRSCEKPWTQLTPRDKVMIKAELNAYKRSEMEVHPESEQYTRYHY